MSNYSVQLEGTEQLLQNLKRIDSNIRGSVALQAVNAGAIQIENRAKQNAPVLTGALRNSASTKARNTSNGAEAEIGFRGLAYARIQEFGGRAGRHHSVTIKGKHYLENAINQEKVSAVNAMSDVVRSYLEK